MNKLNKDETKKYIIKIFNFIENGDSKFKGHPGLYFFHTKKELEEKIKELINTLPEGFREYGEVCYQIAVKRSSVDFSSPLNWE